MKKPNDTKQRIFETAAELFAQKGYHAVSMRDISKQIGIRTGSIYNHYKSKEDIMDALLERYLERMERFYERMQDINTNIPDGAQLEELLQKIMLFYEPDEAEMMYYLTRIVHHEQFTFRKAAEALIGSGYRKYMEAHVQFFDRLSDAGYITGKANNHMYAELFARISLTFATQFLHPDITPTVGTQVEMYQFVIEMVLSHEREMKRKRGGDDEPGVSVQPE